MSYCLCAPVTSLLHPVCTTCHFVAECLPIPQAPLQKCLHCSGTSRVYVVTGGNRGVGYACCRLLLQRGETVYLLSRDATRGKEAVASLKKATKCTDASIESFRVDLSDLDSVLVFVKEVVARKVLITGLLNNAGAIVQNSMEVNHLGHFALTLGLLPMLCPATSRDHLSTTEGIIVAPSYIVNVSSVASWQAFDLGSSLDTMASDASSHGDSWSGYADSKAANAVFSLALSDQLAQHKVVVSSYHPGVMLTDLWSSNSSNSPQAFNTAVNTCCFLCIKQPCVSALGLVSLAHPRCCYSSEYSLCAPDSCAQRMCTGSGGDYYQQCCCFSVCPVRAPPQIYNRSLQLKLIDTSFIAVEKMNKELYDLVRGNWERIKTSTSGTEDTLQNDTQPTNANAVNINARKSNCHIYPSLPCTEVLSLAPFCACVAFIC